MKSENCQRAETKSKYQKDVPNVHTSLAATISKACKHQIIIKEGPPLPRERERERERQYKRTEKKSIETVNYANNIDFSIINNLIQTLVENSFRNKPKFFF